ncbi:MAG: hypothetical protein PVJ77_24725 [Desulfobacterales bacterium]
MFSPVGAPQAGSVVKTILIVHSLKRLQNAPSDPMIARNDPMLDPAILFPMQLKMNENRRGVKLWMGVIQKAAPESKGLQHHRHVICKYAIFMVMSIT